MADASFWAHTTVLARRTRANIRDYAGQIAGLAKSDLESVDSAVLNRMINDEQEEWRLDFPGLRGYGQAVSTETWDTDNTRHELPTDFAELGSGGRVTLLDTSGNESDQLEIITREAYEQSWQQDHNRYEDRDDPVAYLYGVSTNGKRFIEIRPTPTSAIQFRVYYTALLADLDNDADEIEAPIPMHSGIEHGVAARFAMYFGSPKMQILRAEAERIKNKFRQPIADERKRPSRFRTFEERSVGGYKGFEFAE